MESCPSVEKLQGFLADLIAGEELEALTEHVNDCPACLETLERLTGVQPSVPTVLSTSPLKTEFMERLKHAAPGSGGETFLGDATPAWPPPPPRSHWPSLPDYRILEELGRGGMGVVYRAHQISLNRLVALKMVLAGAGASPAVLTRFHTEAEAVARLQHVNIVQIFAIGEHEGRPFLALELVEGETLARRLNNTPQRPLAAAALVETLARAIHVAHQLGIVHRDLKPSNILLKGAPSEPSTEVKTLKAGTPTPSPLTRYLAKLAPPSTLSLHRTSRTTPLPVADVVDYGIPKITDFGLAKLMDGGTQLTQTGDLMGTPSYMAPEQATATSRSDGSGERTGAAADIYSLGAILYEMLTGRPPFKGETSVETLLQVLHQDPVSPSRLQPKVPPDLATICLKCLEKQPSKRYETAEDLAEDLRRVCAGEPIRARRVGVAGHIWRWCRRRPAVAAMAGALAASLVLGFVGMGVLWLRAEYHRGIAVENARQADAHRQRAASDADRAEAGLYFSRIAQARLEWRLNNPTGAAVLLEQCAPRPNQVDRRGWEWYHLMNMTHSELLAFAAGGKQGMNLASVRFSGDGQKLVLSGGKVYERPVPHGRLEVWDLKPWFQGGNVALVREIPEGIAYGSAIAVSRDGGQIAIGEWTGEISIWENGRLRKLAGHNRMISSIAVSPDGTRLVAADQRNRTTVHDLKTGDILHEMPGVCADFLDGGRQILTLDVLDPSAVAKLSAWDTASGRLVRSIAADATAFRLAPDGKTLVLWKGAKASLLDWSTGQLGATLAGHDGVVAEAAFSPDGLHVATAGSDRTVRVWNTRNGIEEVTLRGHVDLVKSLAFHPSGRYLVSVDQNTAEIKLWDLTRHPEFHVVGGIPVLPREQRRWNYVRGALAIGFSPDSSKLLELRTDGLLCERDARGGPETSVPRLIAVDRAWKVPATVAAFSPDCTRVAGVDEADPTHVHLWSTMTGQTEITLVGHTVDVYHVAWSGDGRRVVTAGFNLGASPRRREVHVWDAETGWLIRRFHPGSFPEDVRWLHGVAALNPDGSLVAFDDYNATENSDRSEVVVESSIKICDVNGDRERTYFAGRDDSFASIVFSTGGKMLAAATREGGEITVRDVTTGRLLHSEPLRSMAASGVGMLAFSPDDRLLAAVYRDQLQVWHATTGHEVLTLRGAPPRSGDNAFNPRLAWSPDGRLLAGLNHNATISVWDGRESDLPANRLKTAESRAFAWHLVHAQVAIHDPSLRDGARFHLDAIDQLEPPSDLARLERAAVRARVGAWNKAVADYAAAGKKDKLASAGWLSERALLEYQTGDRAGWRRSLAELRERFRGSRQFDRIEQMLSAFLLLPETNADPDDLARWCEVLKQRRSEAHPRNLYPGIVLYRAGKYQEAIQALEPVVQAGGDGFGYAPGWAFLAMAHARLGHSEEATRWRERLDHALASLDATTSQKPTALIPPAVEWPNWLEAQLLRREVASVVDAAQATSCTP